MNALLSNKGPKRLFMYALCGGSGVVLDFAVYSLLLALGIFYQYANVVGYASGTLLSFVLNRLFTFQVFDAPLRRLTLFFAVAAAGLSVSWLILFILVGHLDLNPILAKAMTLVAVLVLQFTLNSAVTFRAGRVAATTEPL